jgi:hypothetical protein
VANAPDPRDAATLLHWSGMALIGVFVVGMLFASWPIALLQPDWQQSITDRLIGAASFPLLGALLMVLAYLLAPELDPIAKQVRRMRRLATWAAIGFALLVPLKTYVGYKQLGAAALADRQALARVGQAIKALEGAESEPELRQALGMLPGAPPLPPAKLTEPVPQIRDQLLDEIRPQVKRLETTSQGSQSSRWQSWLKTSLRDALVTLLYAMAFAAIGQAAPGRLTLLQALTRPRRPSTMGQGWRMGRKEPLIPSGLVEEDETPMPSTSRPRVSRKSANPWSIGNKGKNPVDLSEWVDGDEEPPK